MVRQAPAATLQILETAGCLGARLILPKLRLATLIIIFITIISSGEDAVYCL